MLELELDLDLEGRPLEDSLGDTSRDPLLLQMMSCMILLNGKTPKFYIVYLLKPACAAI